MPQRALFSARQPRIEFGRRLTMIREVEANYRQAQSPQQSMLMKFLSFTVY